MIENSKVNRETGAAVESFRNEMVRSNEMNTQLLIIPLIKLIEGQTMKLSIIPSDTQVCIDGVCHTGLTWDGTPTDVHALQWSGNKGEVEYNDEKPNEAISTLPDWALNAEASWITANTATPADATVDVRIQRDWYLRNYVDAVGSNPMRWAELTSDKQAEWALYRRALLDITLQADFPNEVIWPTKPEVQL